MRLSAEQKGERFLGALDRRAEILQLLADKKEQYGVMKKKEEMMSDEERQELAEVYGEIRDLESELKDSDKNELQGKTV